MPLVFVLIVFLLTAAMKALDNGEFGSAGVCVWVAVFMLVMAALDDESHD